MQDTEPMPAVEVPQTRAARTRWVAPSSVAFVAGAALALFVACLWMHVELSGLRGDVRGARQAAVSAELAADRLAANVQRGNSDSAAPDGPSASEDALPAAQERAREEPAPEMRPAPQPVALRTGSGTSIRAQLHALKSIVRELIDSRIH